MVLPFPPPLQPMLAKLSTSLPTGDGWLYEPKWDGFRALVFAPGHQRNGDGHGHRDDDDAVYLQSRDLKPLGRYFPELVDALGERLPVACVLDFEALLLRIHPAASRIELLAHQTPASFVAWDLLAVGDEDLRARPLRERRARLEELLRATSAPLFLAPATTDRHLAEQWFRHFEGAGLDGIVSKRLDGLYTPGVRTMVKTKHARTADCVVAGLRWLKGHEGTHVGSLLLGLFDDDGVLQHVGVCGAFTTQKRRELAALLEPLRKDARADHPWRGWADWKPTSTTTTTTTTTTAEVQRMPGASSRWNAGKDLSWEPLRPELVCEVAYDHLQGARFRHATQFVRWRPDKAPADCRYDQLEVTPPHELASIFQAGSSAAPARSPRADRPRTARARSTRAHADRREPGS